jgi:hypothetical protein
MQLEQSEQLEQLEQLEQCEQLEQPLHLLRQRHQDHRQFLVNKIIIIFHPTAAHFLMRSFGPILIGKVSLFFKARAAVSSVGQSKLLNKERDCYKPLNKEKGC